MSRSYLDHASTSPLRAVARDAMVRALDVAASADPGRVHTEGRMARVALEEARASVAALFGARPREVVFTSGAVESINAVCWGASRRAEGRTTHALAAVEHSAVREGAARFGSVVTLPVDRNGRLEAAALDDLVDPTTTAIVHCQWANHEVGTLQPVVEVVEWCRAHDVLVHIDAAAAGGHVPIAFDALGADLMSLDAHTMGGPVGIGALLVRRGLRLDPFVLGGDQERARRAGLENLPAAAGWAAACDALAADGGLEAEALVARAQTDALVQAATKVPSVVTYGDPVDRLPHLVCLGVDGVEAEAVLLGLDQAGIAAHSGSSCSSEALEPSPVLEAMGVDARHSLRLSVGWTTTDDDVTRFATAFPEVVGRLRALG